MKTNCLLCGKKFDSDMKFPICFDCDSIYPQIQINLIECLYHNGTLLRSELVDKLGHPRTTLYDNLLILETKDVVKRVKKRRPDTSDGPARGRPNVLWSLKVGVES